MWWLLAVPIVWGGKALYDAVTEDEKPPQPAPRKKSTLELNLERLRRQLNAYPGRKVAILGQPGAGKSSLLKTMTKGEVVPLPIIGAHTDATNWAQDDSCSLLSHYNEIAFADVPGYDTASHPVAMFISFFPFELLDVFVFVINGKIHSADEEIFRALARSNKRFCIARSFSDTLEDKERSSASRDIKNKLFPDANSRIIFFSNRSGEGHETVLNFVTHK